MVGVFIIFGVGVLVSFIVFVFEWVLVLYLIKNENDLNVFYMLWEVLKM